MPICDFLSCNQTVFFIVLKLMADKKKSSLENFKLKKKIKMLGFVPR